ncbi:cytoplasmic trna 2-thiolation 2 [Paramyrothecium foliicola]|nr:cytoplasmic trna 2-thiolation 2 [Paramyrothecium foliicola]
MVQVQDEADIKASVLSELAGTPYEPSSLKKLTGGTANFIYRATLKEALADGVSDVAIKHGEGYVALSPGFTLSTSRCHVEEKCLRLLSELPPFESPAFTVATPRIYHFGAETNTQIQEYLPNAVSLKEYALKHCSDKAEGLHEGVYVKLGEALGVWLRAFHEWGRRPPKHRVREPFAENKMMQSLKQMINYKQLVAMADKHPEVLQDARDTLQQISDATAAELADDHKLDVIHGDFWTGNVILPNTPIEGGNHTPIRVIDWEMAQLGIQPLDLGQMIAELWQLKLYKSIDAGLWLIKGFVAGYGKIGTADAFRVILHVGAHLICFGAHTPGWGSAEQQEEILKTGKDVLLKAWSKDREAFKGHALECIFSNCYLEFINLKVNKRLAALHKDTRTSLAPTARRYLAGLSFGPSSSALVAGLESIALHHASKKSSSEFEPLVVHIDTDLSPPGDASAAESPAQRLLAKYRERFPNLSFDCVHLTKALDVRTIDWTTLPQWSATDTSDPLERLRRLFDALPSVTSRADVLRQLVRHLLLHVARERSCSALLLAHSTTALAALTLSEVAGGRGFSVPWQVNDGQFPLRDYGAQGAAGTSDAAEVPSQFPIYFPLREVFLDEIKTYVDLVPSLSEIMPRDTAASANVVSHKDLSIDEVMSRYFQGVEGAYSSIVANVVRTAGKLERASSGDSCRFCGVTLDEHGDTTWAGEMGDEQGEHSGLCYGCKRSLNG